MYDLSLIHNQVDYFGFLVGVSFFLSASIAYGLMRIKYSVMDCRFLPFYFLGSAFYFWIDIGNKFISSETVQTL